MGLARSLKSAMENKTLKFRKYLISLILSSKKDTTWRINDEKDLKINDIVTLINWDTNKVFGEAKIIKVDEKKMADLSENEVGHEKFKDRQEMLDTYRKYYGDWVGDDTIIKIIKFKLE